MSLAGMTRRIFHRLTRKTGLTATAAIAVIVASIVGRGLMTEENARDFVARSVAVQSRLDEPGQPSIRKHFAMLVVTDAAKAVATTEIAMAMCADVADDPDEYATCLTEHARDFDSMPLCRSGRSRPIAWGTFFPMTKAEAIAVRDAVQRTPGLSARSDGRVGDWESLLSSRALIPCPPVGGL